MRKKYTNYVKVGQTCEHKLALEVRSQDKLFCYDAKHQNARRSWDEEASATTPQGDGPEISSQDCA